jgi:hypothetical protein
VKFYKGRFPLVQFLSQTDFNVLVVVIVVVVVMVVVVLVVVVQI